MRWASRAGPILSALLAVAAATPGPAQEVARAESRAILRALEAALLLSGQEGGAIRTAVLAVPFPAAAGAAPVAIVVEAEGGPLAGELQAGALTVDLFVYALGDGQEVVSSASRRVTVDLARHGALLRRTGLKMPLAIELPPGEHRLRVLVRSRDGAFGIRSAEVTVPGPEARATLPLLFPEPPGRWLLGLTQPATGLEPFAVAGEPFLPAALPVAAAGDSLSGWLMLPASEASGLAATVLLKHNDTGELRELSLKLGPRLPTPTEGLAAIPFELTTAGLPGGLYTVRAAHGGPGRGSAATASTVLALAGAGGERAWPQLDLDGPGEASDDEATVAAGAQPGPPSADGPAPGGLAEALPRAYEPLAAGDLDEAGSRLRALQASAARVGGAEALAGLEALEWRLVQELAASEPERLLGLLCLYAELAGGYQRTRELRLGSHAGRLARRIAASYVRAMPTPEARDQAALVLTSLGGSLIQAGVLGEATETFEAALELVPGQAAALLGLAAVQEKQGRFGHAVTTLERLTAARPEHAEATLRLALNLGRTDRAERARGLLEGLAELPAPRWVAQLAHQEAARLALDAHRAGEAEAILRRGLERWPDDPSLKILLAWVMDRRQRPREADRLLELADRAGALATARYRYSGWPRETLELDPRGLLGERRSRKAGSGPSATPGGP